MTPGRNCQSHNSARWTEPIMAGHLQTRMNSERDGCKHKYISDRSRLRSWLRDNACSKFTNGIVKKKMAARGIY
jgi:hypothetical protein